MDEIARIAELRLQGFHCSQIIIMLALEIQGKENPDLVRAMNGLAGGLGFNGNVCGALTGAACMIGLFAGRGELDEREDHKLNMMIQELIIWFEERFGNKYGGLDCSKIIGDDPWNKMTVCPDLVKESYLKAKEILLDNDYIDD